MTDYRGLLVLGGALGVSLAIQRLWQWYDNVDPLVSIETCIEDMFFRGLLTISGAANTDAKGQSKFSRGTFEGVMGTALLLSRPVKSLKGYHVEIKDIVVPGPTGINIKVRTFTPQDVPEGTTTKVLMYMHGGGFCLFHPEDPHYSRVCRNFAAMGHTVFSVDYALAPEHQFPEGLGDCYAVLDWLCSDAPVQQGFLPPCPRFLTVAGDSAGGNFTLVLGLLAANGLGPTLEPLSSEDAARVKIDHLVPLYPTLNVRSSPSRVRIGPKAMFIPTWVIEAFGNMYIQGRVDRLDWRICPSRASQELIGQLPPMTLVTCTLDPLHDEGVDFVVLARQSGATCCHIEVKDVHAFLTAHTPNALSTYHQILANIASGGRNTDVDLM